MKKLIAFDLDGTIAPSKSPLPDEMAELFPHLLDKFDVCVISGGKFGQFETQLLNGLHASDAQLVKLHIMPTCGTQYYRYDTQKDMWQRRYAELLTEAEKKKIIAALNQGFADLGYVAEKTYGETAEDRESQITYSVLGQDIVTVLGEEGLKMKEAWDPDDRKKQAVRDYVAPLLPEFEVRVGGVTSIDVTKPGIDKAYGMSKLMDALQIDKDDILFMGDRIRPGGNDYPVKEMGIDSLEVSDWRNTAQIITGILHVL
ncbi:MAG TPA: HAD-IIB family hydrolase [Candidatus Saccharimonadales bacterium]|nr:HAD-IIB family hydrolase [Candidatus Saccharimonadales bacterium]